MHRGRGARVCVCACVAGGGGREPGTAYSQCGRFGSSVIDCPAKAYIQGYTGVTRGHSTQTKKIMF